MNKTLKAIATLGAAVMLASGLTACSSDADIASQNISKDADNFKVLRRVVFYNGITDTYLLSIEGYCSLGNNDKAGQLSVTCKTGSVIKKNFLGLSDNVTYFVEQIEGSNVSTDHYKVIFNPSEIIPDVEVR